MTNQSYFALDLATSHGFYFGTYEEYQRKMMKAGFEEVEIQLIDGNAPLFDACGITQGESLERWFDELEDLDDDKDASIRYLVEIGYSLDQAISKMDDIQIWRGSAEDYAANLVEQTTDTSSLGWLGNYIDYEGIARDMQLNSEITKIEHGIWIVNCNDF